MLLAGSIPADVFAEGTGEPEASVNLTEGTGESEVSYGEQTDTENNEVSSSEALTGTDEDVSKENIEETSMPSDEEDNTDEELTEGSLQEESADDELLTEEQITEERTAYPEMTGTGAADDDEGTPGKITFGLGSLKRGDTVLFGEWKGSPITWRVLTTPDDNMGTWFNNGKRALLVSEYILENTLFNNDNMNGKWAGSLAQKWCMDFYGSAAVWPVSGEKSAIATVSTKESESEEFNYQYVLPSRGVCFPAPLDNEHIFFLAGEEADKCFKDDADRIAYPVGSTKPAEWWLRSPGKYSYPNPAMIFIVEDDGRLYHSLTPDVSSSYGARPALNLDSDAVLFACAADGKPDADGSMGSLPDNESGEWKLTVKDSGRKGFSISGSPDSTVPGGTIDITYSGAQTGDNEYISVIIRNSEGELTAYGSVPANTAQGKASFEMPAQVPAGTYTLIMFNEQRNSGVSDIAGNIVEAPVKIGLDAKVSVNGGKDKEVTYGNPGFTLTGSAADPGEGSGKWQWSSSDESVASIDKDTGRVTVNHIGSTTITGSYESSTTAGEASITLTIKKKTLRISAWENTVFTYDGDTQIPKPVLSGVLTGDDCTVTVSGGQTDAGSGYIAEAGTLNGTDTDNYELSDENKSCTFTIKKAVLNASHVHLGKKLDYNGSEQTQDVTVKIYNTDVTDKCTITGNKGKDPGTYTLTVTADNDNFSGSVTKEFTIDKKTLTLTVTVQGSYTYTGDPKEPPFTVKYSEDGHDHTLDPEHYQAEYIDNIHAGTGRVVVRPKESSPYNFAAAEGTFPIAKAEYSGPSTIYYTCDKIFPYDKECEYKINYGALPGLGKTHITDVNDTVNSIDDTPLDHNEGYLPDMMDDPDNKTITLRFKKTNRPHEDRLVFMATSDDYDGNFRFEYSIIRGNCVSLSEKGKKDRICSEKIVRTGTSFSLLADLPDGATGVVWSSSDPAVAAVTQDGKVTAYSAGTAVIKAVKNTIMPGETAGSEEYAECLVTVKDRVPITSITLSDKNCTLMSAHSKTISAVIAPATAEQSLVWTNSNTSVLSIEPSDDGRSVVVNGIAPGKATLTAMTTDGSGRKAACTVTVNDDSCYIESNGEEITGGLPQYVLYLEAGRPHTMKLIWDSKGKHPDDSIWSISKASDIAAITPGGVITGLKSGQVTVKAKGYYGTVDRLVRFYVPVKSAALNVTSGTVSMADDAKGLQLHVNITSKVPGVSASGVKLTDEPTVEWSVDPKYSQYLSVSDTGLVSAGAKPGKNIPVVATVKAWNGYVKKLTCKVTVKESNPLKGIKISNTKVSIGEGNTYRLTAAINPFNADGDDWYSWLSSDETIVKVDRNSGVITAMAPGTATITVTAAGTVTSKGKTDHPAAACKVTVTPSVKAITFTNGGDLSDKGLNKGKSYTLKTKLELTGSGKAATTGLEWKSSDERIATVSKKGVVKAIAPGNVTITAISTDSKDHDEKPYASVSFTVYATIKKIKADRSKLTLGTQENCRYGKVSIASVTPADATNVSIQWTTDASGSKVSLSPLPAGSDPSLCSYSEPGESVTTMNGEELAIKALSPGVVKLTGTTMDGSKKKMTVTVTIRGQVTDFRLKTFTTKSGQGQVDLETEGKYVSTLKAGKSLTLTPISDINDTVGDSSDKAVQKIYNLFKKYTDTGVYYRSSDTAVATVNKKGKITVNKKAAEGQTATIYATTSDGKKTVQIKITVVK